MTELKVGQRVWHKRLDHSSKNGQGPQALVNELEVYKVIPNYMDKLGLHYACRKPGSKLGMAYRPDRLYTSRKAAVDALNAQIDEHIATLLALKFNP